MISIIIPNYNGVGNLKKNLPKILEIASKRNDCEIIVVDDASTDESVKYLREVEGGKKGELNLQIIVKDKNTGFSSTVNAGVKESTGENLLLLNTDVIPQGDLIDKLCKSLVGDVFAVGALNKVIENGKEKLEGRGVGKWTKGFLIHSAGVMDKRTTLWVSGGA